MLFLTRGLKTTYLILKKSQYSACFASPHGVVFCRPFFGIYFFLYVPYYIGKYDFLQIKKLLFLNFFVCVGIFMFGCAGMS